MENELFTAPAKITMPSLNQPAPEFRARTTLGEKCLSEYRGKWLVLFSHPGDFTPVCTTEFIAFARRHEEFRKLNCELLGLSVDSVYSHIAWIRNIREKFGTEITFPIIEDASLKVATLYGMIQPSASMTVAVRALFVIDDRGILRSMNYYPINVGRSVSEILRLVEALQTSDRLGVATPEGWLHGQPVILPAPASLDEAADRARDGQGCTEWYFCRRELHNLEEIREKAHQAKKKTA